MNKSDAEESRFSELENIVGVGIQQTTRETFLSKLSVAISAERGRVSSLLAGLLAVVQRASL